METGSRKAEALLGAIVLLVSAMFVWLSLEVGGGAPQGAVRYSLMFDSALGLTVDNAVAIAGVKIGVVDGIGIEGREARVTVAVEPGVQLFENAKASVRAKTLLGEKYIDLDPGDDTAAPLQPGDVVRHNDPTVEIDQVIRASAALVSSLNEMTPPIEKAVTRLDELLRETDGEEVATSLASTLGDLGRLIRETTDLIGQSSEDVQFVLKLTRDRGPEIIQRIEQATERVDSILAAIDPKVVKRVSDRLDPATEKADQLLTELQLAMADVKSSARKLDDVLVRVDKSLARTDDLNERTIREFLQVEGVRVNLIPDAKVERRLRKLRNESAPLPVP